MKPNEAFFSHSSTDHEFVTDVTEAMRMHGVPVWYSKTEILGARQWHDEIGAALRRCDWFVLILSPASVKSMWVKRELLFALQQNLFADRIVPLLYQDCDFASLSCVLPSFETVDFRQGFKQGCRDLLRMWGMGYVG